MFEPTKEKVRESGRKLHNEKFCNLYSSPSIISVNKSRRITMSGTGKAYGRVEELYKILVRKPEGRDHLEDREVDVSLIS
jgi:hypothetical protein